MTPAARARDRLGGRRGLTAAASAAIRTARSAASSSAAVGIPSRAPARVTASAGRDDRPTRGLRQVEAVGQAGGQRAVERVAGTDRVDGRRRAGRGSRVDRRPATSIAPSAPRLTRTDRFPPDPSSRLACAAGLPGPASSSSSPSLGVRMSARSSVGRAEPAGRGRVEDRRRARDPAEPERLVGGPGPDLVADEDDVAGGRDQALERGPDLRPRSAPRWRRSATAIAFSPARSTRIRATPVASPGSVEQPADRSIPSASSAARASAPNASSPTAPMNATSAPRAAPRRPPGCRPCRRDAARSGRR